MNIICEQIGDVLKDAREPMTAQQIAAILGYSKQTIFNNMPGAVENGFAEDTGKTISRAKLFAFPDNAHKFRYTITWGEKREPLKDLFKRWAKEMPKDAISRLFARQLMRIYKLSVDYLEDFDGSKYNATDRIIQLKEERAYYLKMAQHLEAVAKACRTIYNTDELWSPQTFVEVLIIKDGDTTPSEIRSLLDTYNEQKG